MGRSGTILFHFALLCSTLAYAEPERPCPACGHDMARAEGAVAGAADYLCRFCEVAVHAQPDGRELVSFRIDHQRREFEMVDGAPLFFPLPEILDPEDVLVPVDEAAFVAADDGGHPVQLPGHPVGLPGHPVRLPGHPVNLPAHAVELPGPPVELPEAPVELPGFSVTLPRPAVKLPSHPVRLPAPPVGLPGHAIGLPGHAVGLPGQPLGMSGSTVVRPPPVIEPTPKREPPPVVEQAPVQRPPSAMERPSPRPPPQEIRVFGRPLDEVQGTVPAWSASSERRSSSLLSPPRHLPRGRIGSRSS